MATSSRMVLVIDEDVPRPVADFLRERGHILQLVAESTIKGEADEVVCALADQIGGIVVTWNHRHYARLLPRVPQSGELRFPNCGRISFTCPAPMGVPRLEAVIADIEREHDEAQGREDKRLLVTVDKTRFSFER